MTTHNKTIEQHEVFIEDLNQDIKRLNEFVEYTQDTRIDTEVKRDILHRLESEIEWLEQIRAEEQEAVLFKDCVMFDTREDRLIDEEIIKKHEGEKNE